MKPSFREAAALLLILTLLLARGGTSNASNETKTAGPVRLNQEAFENLKRLIVKGDVIADQRGVWNQHRLSAEEENRFIQLHGFEEYAKWHLGIDDRHSMNSKARYKFPCGDFKIVHRCALLAAEGRASQFKHHDIQEAAVELRQLIEKQQTTDSVR